MRPSVIPHIKACLYPALALLLLLLTSFAAAQNITGTVTNATTGKPSAGDEVTLLSLSQGMQEIGKHQERRAGPLLVAGACR